MFAPHRTPLVLLAGLGEPPVRLLADRLTAGTPATALVHHDLRHADDGIIRRRVRLGSAERIETVALDHGCVSCTLRRDLLPLLRGLSRRPEVERIVVQLDEALEPELVCHELHTALVDDTPVTEDVAVEAVVTVVDQASWLAAATGDTPLAEAGLHAGPGDDRTLAQAAVAQAEFADVLVLAGEAPDAWTAARTGAVLQRLAPRAALLDLCGTGTDRLLGAVPGDGHRGTPRDPHDPLVTGQPPLEADCGVTLTMFTAQRPFHPQRLHDALDVLLEGVVRTRGRVWLAGRPDDHLWLESAGGGLGIRLAGCWLDSPHAPAWEDVSPERRTLAALRWDPVWGDRVQELAVLSHRADPLLIDHELRRALLTDDELAAGPDRWHGYPDPFGTGHDEPCDDTAAAEPTSAGDRPTIRQEER
ncbi:GTP-binding protein [Prauserella halophila]|uniref:GTP-binding protein n=1 Tax=Prauserella halophila TaxID=185641 RepID=A0ABP4GZL1_9PSEU|nr:GTP-binding protein [Prauserella halophila]MCP2237129.1 GTPase, G3E family [Prauserella halophila]